MADYYFVKAPPYEIHIDMEDVDEAHPKLHFVIELTRNAIFIRPRGYGGSGSADGCGWPVIIEVDHGHPRVHIFADINVENPTMSVSLDGAKEDKRREEL